MLYTKTSIIFIVIQLTYYVFLLEIFSSYSLSYYTHMYRPITSIGGQITTCTHILRVTQCLVVYN